jgi:hypothetical protein
LGWILLLGIGFVLVWTPAAGARQVRDVGQRLGLPRLVTSWDVAKADLTGDGAQDLIVSYHSRTIFYANRGDTFEILFSQDKGDVHGCAAADVDLNGLLDVYCTRGAQHGTIAKRNRLWMQQSPGVFVDMAGPYGVTDPFGRGRRTAFIDVDHDRYPDLFVGNNPVRRDAELSPNRTFLNDGGSRFVEVRLDITRDRGANCIQTVDFNGDGWKDLLLCGADRLFIYRNQRSPTGRRFGDVTRRIIGERPAGVVSARFADFDRDGRLDLALVRRDRFEILHRSRKGTLGPVMFQTGLVRGTWVAVANIDGSRGPDALLVQGCLGDRNVNDKLFVNGGAGRLSQIGIPSVSRGCGDVAASIDVDGDKMDEIVVLNGRPPTMPGPVQVLTKGALGR